MRSSPAVASSSGALADLLAPARRRSGRAYVPPTAEELAAYAAWFAAALEAASAQQSFEGQAPRGFEATGDARYLVLGEQAGEERGAGLVLLRRGGARPIVIEAPHTFSDLGTLELAQLTFERLEARALLVSTMHRSSAETLEERSAEARSGESPSDVAHAEESFFSVAHERLCAARPALATIQLHGFADDRAPGVDAVLSAARTAADARGVANAVARALPAAQIRVYPDDIRDLGGVRNAQAALSRAARSPFLHVELSATLRARLRDEPALAERLGDALGTVSGRP